MSEVRDALKTLTMFETLPDDALDILAAGLKSRSIKAGQVLFNYGDPGEELIIVRQGSIAIYMPEKDRPEAGQAIRIFKSGELFGEMALLDSKPRSTSARAEEDTDIWGLDTGTFHKLLSAHPEVAVSVMGGLSGRIRYTTDFIGEMRQWVKRMADGDYKSVKAPVGVDDSSLSALAADFVRMAAQVREREEKLQQEVAQLKIQIDEVKRRESVSEITQSDYYVSLKDKLKAMRDADDDD